MRSIKARLIILITLTFAIVIGGISLALDYFLKKELVHDAKQHMKALAIANASAVEEYIRTQEKVLFAVSEDTLLTDPNVTLDQQIAALEPRAEERGYDYFILIDPSGKGVTLNAERKSLELANRGYFQEALAGNMSISDILTSKDTGQPIFVVATPLKLEDKVVGVLAGVKSGDFLSKSSIKLTELAGTTGTAYFVNKEGRLVGHPDEGMMKEQINFIEAGKKDPVYESIGKVMESTVIKEETGTTEYSLKGRDKYLGFSTIKGTPWIFVSGQDKPEVLATLYKIIRVFMIISLLALIIAALVAIFIAGTIAKPIKDLSGCVNNMANNYDLTLTDQTPSVIYSKRGDEIGEISRSLVGVKKIFQEMMSKINEIASQVSASSEQLNATSDQSANASEGIAQAMDGIAKGAQNQAEDMQKGTEAMNVMEGVMNENEHAIDNLNATVDGVYKAKENGVQKIKALIEATQKSESASGIIVEVISNTNDNAMKIASASDMIKSIADQTNLLALNAAIEAARAGEAGKGFAVVAEEIRKLAEQSNNFTEEISSVVSGLTSKTTEAVQIMQTVGNITKEQSTKVTETNEQFEVIALELDKIEQVTGQLNQSGKELANSKNNMLQIIENLSALSEENAAVAEESTASAEEQTASAQEIASSSAHLAEMAQELTEMISVFKL